MMPSHAALPILLGLGSAAVWGAADFAGGLAARRGRPGSVVFLAHGISLLVLVAVALLVHPAAIPGLQARWALLSGISGAVALMLFYEALAEGGMGLSAALAGVLTAALPVSLSFVREGLPGIWQIAGFATAAVAIALIAWAPGEATRPRSLMLATLGGLGFGVQLVVLHIASAQGSVLRALVLSRVGGTATGAVVVLAGLLLGRRRGAFPGEASARAGKGARSWGWHFVWLAMAAGLLDAAGNGIYMSAALVGRLDVAAVLSSLYPGSTILLAAWLLKERTTRLQTVGMVLALVAVALISV